MPQLGRWIVPLGVLFSMTRSAAADVKYPPPDRADFGMSYMSMGPSGGETRTAAGIALNAAWSPAVHIAGASPGLAFWDSLYLEAGFGKMLSTPVGSETGIGIDFAAGYQFLAGWRTESWTATGGIGVDYGTTFIGDASVGGLSFPLVGHGEIMMGDKRISATARAGFLGARKQYGLDAKFPLSRKWGLGASACYFSGSEDATGMMPAVDTSGFSTALLIRIDNL